MKTRSLYLNSERMCGFLKKTNYPNSKRLVFTPSVNVKSENSTIIWYYQHVWMRYCSRVTYSENIWAELRTPMVQLVGIYITCHKLVKSLNTCFLRKATVIWYWVETHIWCCSSYFVKTFKKRSLPMGLSFNSCDINQRVDGYIPQRWAVLVVLGCVHPLICPMLSYCNIT